MSKFFTIDLYIAQTIAEYPAMAIQVRTKTHNRAVPALSSFQRSLVYV